MKSFFFLTAFGELVSSHMQVPQLAFLPSESCLSRGVNVILLCKLNTFAVHSHSHVWMYQGMCIYFPVCTIYAVVFVKGGSLFTSH